MPEMVNHPDHYQDIAGVEAIDILNDVVQGLDPVPACMLWNCMKYLLRFKNKNGVQDLKKAKNYLNWLIESLDKDETENKKAEDKPKVKPIISVVIEVDDGFSDFLKEDRCNQLATLNKLTRLFDTALGAVSIRDIALAIGAKELVSKNGGSMFHKPYAIQVKCNKGEKSKLIFKYIDLPMELNEYAVSRVSFKTHDDAIKFLNYLADFTDQYTFVTVADFYQKLAMPTRLKDFKYGWAYEDLNKAIVYCHYKGKYILEMPKAKALTNDISKEEE